jgi:hypothetical protein
MWKGGSAWPGVLAEALDPFAGAKLAFLAALDTFTAEDVRPTAA